MRFLILPLAIFLMGCDGPPEYIEVKPDFPAPLLDPCPLSERVAKTYRDLAILATEHKNTAICANGRITSIAEIVAQ